MRIKINTSIDDNISLKKINRLKYKNENSRYSNNKIHFNYHSDMNKKNLFKNNDEEDNEVNKKIIENEQNLKENKDYI